MAAVAQASSAVAAMAACRPKPLSSRRADSFPRTRVGASDAAKAGTFRRRPTVVRAAIFHTAETLRAIDRLEANLPADALSTLGGASSGVRTPLMAGNWKMNPKTLQEAEVSSNTSLVRATHLHYPLPAPLYSCHPRRRRDEMRSTENADAIEQNF